MLSSQQSPYRLDWLDAIEVYNSAPTAPTWTNTSGTVEDVASTLLLDWTFNDAESDPQSDFTVKRRIGAAAANYWNGTSWQASEDASTKIATATESHLMASSWGADTDDDHYYSVKTWDPLDEVSPWSSELRVIPSTKSNPTVTSPTESATVGISPDVEWTCTTQTSYRIVVSTDASSSNMDAGTLEHDSGWILDGAGRTATVACPTNTVTRYIKLQTKNFDGLHSDIYVRTVDVSYTPPSTPTMVISETVTGALRVAITNPASTPSVTWNEVYRRIGTGPYIRIANNIAPNGTFDDWAVAAGVTYDYKVIAHADNGTYAESTT